VDPELRKEEREADRQAQSPPDVLPIASVASDASISMSCGAPCWTWQNGKAGSVTGGAKTIDRVP